MSVIPWRASPAASASATVGVVTGTPSVADVRRSWRLLAEGSNSVWAAVRSCGYRRGMDLRRLQYFAVVAQELHFRRAAERLHIAQPGLSQQIKVLEREVGATLLERSTGGVTLTEAGRVLLDEGTSLLQEVNR